MALAWAPNDERMAIVDQLGAMFVWDTTKCTRMYGALSPFAQAVAVSPDQQNPAVLVGGMRNATELFVAEPGNAKMKTKKTWIAHDGYISSVKFLEGGKKYISASGDADIRIFDVQNSASGESLVTIKGHEKDAQSIKYAREPRNSEFFITCSSDKTVKMWDEKAGKCVGTFMTDSELNACDLFPNGDLIACGGEKDKTYVFDVRAYRMAGQYARNNMKTASVAFSKSGRELFVGHDDGALITWDIFTSGENKTYAKKTEAHTSFEKNGAVDIVKSRVQVLDVGPKGFLATGGFDGKVKLWGAPADGA